MSRGYADGGRVEVSVFGGYQDTRGDAARNSLSILNTLQDDPRLLELKHFCVGKYNTQSAKNQNNILSTETTAILKGIAVDIKLQRIFPACYEWGNMDDFKLQIADKRRLKDGKSPMDTEDAHKTADSTFKPKSLKNRANHEYLIKESKPDTDSDAEGNEMVQLKEVIPGGQPKGRKKLFKTEDIYNTLIPGQAFKVKLKHTAINDKTYKKRRKMKTNENNAFNSIET